MSKNKNLILLKDYVNEHILLEQFGELYGCSEGYGYNPFTKECYPIPSDMDPANYKSLAPPKVVKRKSTTGGGTGLPSIGDVKEVLVNVKRLAETPIESSKACFNQHPIASWLGVYTGVGAPGLAPLLRGTGKTLKIASKVVPGGRAGMAIAGLSALVYFGARYFASKQDGIMGGVDIVGDAAQGLVQGSKSLVAGVESLTKNAESIAQQAGKVFDPSSPEGKASAVTSPSCFLLIMAGTFAIRKTGGAILKPISVATIRKSNDFLAYAGKTMSTALLRKSRYMGDSASSAYIALKSSNLLPTSAGKIEMIADGSRSILKVSGAEDIIKIDASKLSAELQKKLSKRIQDGQLIIDTKQVNKELLDISDDVAKSAQKTMEREASDSIRRGSTISDLKKIQKIMARGGDLSSAALRSRYFSSSSEVLVDLVEKQKSNLIKLHKDALELKKLKPSIDPKKLANAHKDIIAGSTPTSVAKDFGISAEYLRKFKTYSSNQTEVLSKFELVREVMEKDAKFTKFYSSDASSTSLKKWFQTPAGANARTGTQKAVATIKDLLPTMEDVWASTGFLKTMKYFAYTAFLGGAIYKGPKLLSGFEKDISLPSLDRSAKVFFQETVAKDYESYFTEPSSDMKINTNKLLGDFQTHYLKTLDKTNNKQVIAAGALKDLVNSSRDNKDVDAHFNRKTARGDWKDLYRDFISFLAGQASPEEEEEEKKGETDMFGNPVVAKKSQKAPQNTGDARKEFPIVNGENWVKPMTTEWKATNTHFNQGRGKGAKHYAIDIGFSEPIGAAVFSAAPGTVTRVVDKYFENSLKAYAKFINNRIDSGEIFDDLKNALSWGAGRYKGSPKGDGMARKANLLGKQGIPKAPVDGEWESFRDWSRKSLPRYGRGKSTVENKTIGALLLRYHNTKGMYKPQVGTGGKSVTIVTDPDQNGHQFTTYYGHLDNVATSKGQTVDAGSQIGGMGRTSIFDDKHLHFAVRGVSGQNYTFSKHKARDRIGRTVIDPEAVIPSLSRNGDGIYDTRVVGEGYTIQQKEVKIMNKLDIRQLVAEILNENSGQGYAQYPYGSSVNDEEEPKEDYTEEWKALSMEVIRDQTRETAIRIAKILVKDLELFEDVLDLAGQNQSIGTEILSKLKQAKENV